MYHMDTKPLVPYSRLSRDILLVYDDEESDCFTNEKLIPVLESNGISFVSLYSNPGSTVSNFLATLRPFPSKILIMLSKEFCNNEKLKFYLDSIFEVGLVELKSKERLTNHIITFVTTGDISEVSGLNFLQKTRMIYHRQGYTVENLVEDLIYDFSSFLTVLTRKDENDIGQSLSLHGLSLKHLSMDIYGLLISISDLCVKIQMDELKKFCKTHKNLSTYELLGRQDILRNPESKVILTLKGKSSQYYNMIKDIVEICSAVVQIMETKGNCSLVCSVAGKYGGNEERLLREMFPKIWYGITERSTSEIEQPYFDSYIDVEKRIASFPPEWKTDEKDRLKIEKIAFAGFFFDGCGTNGRCFSCASVLTNIRSYANPSLKHASQYPGCRYINEILSEKDLKIALNMFNNKEDKAAFANKLEEKYTTYESRHETFVTNSDIFGNADCENLAKAGFYSIGYGSLIQCYKCCVRLFNLPVNEGAWIIHALLSPTCPHLQQFENRKLLTMITSVQQQGICPDETILTLQRFDTNCKTDSKQILFRPW